MNNIRLVLIGALATVALLAVACGDDDNGATQTPTQAHSATATTTAHTTTATATASPQNVCQENPDPATADQVQVTKPAPGDEVTSPMQVTGLIAAFEAQFNIAIKDAAGNDIVAVPAMSSEGQTLAPFSASVTFTMTQRTPACLWVFDYSAMDGSVENVHQVPVVLLP